MSLACLLVVGYGIYATIRVRQLEARLARQELARATTSATPGVTYALTESFRQHFGERGVAIVEAAFIRGVTDPEEILRDLRRDYGIRYEVR